MDFDSFLGHFWENVLNAMITASQILIIIADGEFDKNSEQDKRNQKINSKHSKVLAIICFVICLIMLIIAILGSLLDLGYARPYLDNKTFDLILGNFYPQRFSEVFFVYLILLLGFPFLLFSMGKSIPFLESPQEQKSDRKITKIGKALYLTAYFIIFFFIIIFPVDRASLSNGNSILAMIYSVIALFLSIGIIEFILFAWNNKSNEILSRDPNQIKLNNNKMLKMKLAIGLAVLIVFAIYSLLILQNPPFLQIGVVRFLQYLPGIIFRTCLTIAIVLNALSYTKFKEVK